MYILVICNRIDLKIGSFLFEFNVENIFGSTNFAYVKKKQLNFLIMSGILLLFLIKYL